MSLTVTIQTVSLLIPNASLLTRFAQKFLPPFPKVVQCLKLQENGRYILNEPYHEEDQQPWRGNCCVCSTSWKSSPMCHHNIAKLEMQIRNGLLQYLAIDYLSLGRSRSKAPSSSPTPSQHLESGKCWSYYELEKHTSYHCWIRDILILEGFL